MAFFIELASHRSRCIDCVASFASHRSRRIDRSCRIDLVASIASLRSRCIDRVASTASHRSRRIDRVESIASHISRRIYRVASIASHWSRRIDRVALIMSHRSRRIYRVASIASHRSRRIDRVASCFPRPMFSRVRNAMKLSFLFYDHSNYLKLLWELQIGVSIIYSFQKENIPFSNSVLRYREKYPENTGTIGYELDFRCHLKFMKAFICSCNNL